MKKLHIKKYSRKTLCFVSIFALLLILGTVTICLFEKQRKSLQINKIFCSDSSREGQACAQVYEPVCGYPEKKDYSNFCVACKNVNVEYYVNRECK